MTEAERVEWRRRGKKEQQEEKQSGGVGGGGGGVGGRERKEGRETHRLTETERETQDSVRQTLPTRTEND